MAGDSTGLGALRELRVAVRKTALCLHVISLSCQESLGSRETAVQRGDGLELYCGLDCRLNIGPQALTWAFCHLPAMQAVVSVQWDHSPMIPVSSSAAFPMSISAFEVRLPCLKDKPSSWLWGDLA